MMDDPFLACEQRASRSKPPVMLRDAQNRANYARATNPPPWLRPMPPVQLVVPPQEMSITRYVPPGARPHPDATWPRLLGLLRALADSGAVMPYLGELPDILENTRPATDRAFKCLMDYGWVERVMRPVKDGPPEMRVVLVESGAVLQTRGWKA